jgi:Protein of unknown function (DUF4231)
MTRRKAYRAWLKEDWGKLIKSLYLTESQEHSMRSRWLDQVLWMDGKADRTQTFYYILRMTTIIGGVTIPALVSLDPKQVFGINVEGATFSLSLLVAISAAVEGFFRFGERWRHYRHTAELLKSEGWKFLQLSTKPYRKAGIHEEAYPEFARRVEHILRREEEIFMTDVAQERGEEDDANDDETH